MSCPAVWIVVEDAWRVTALLPRPGASGTVRRRTRSTCIQRVHAVGSDTLTSIPHCPCMEEGLSQYHSTSLLLCVQGTMCSVKTCLLTRTGKWQGLPEKDVESGACPFLDSRMCSPLAAGCELRDSALISCLLLQQLLPELTHDTSAPKPQPS